MPKKSIEVYDGYEDLRRYSLVETAISHALAKALTNGVDSFIFVFNGIRLYIEDVGNVSTSSMRDEYGKKLSKVLKERV